ncbi:MAG: hypothetical protein QOF40_1851, partial [Actinomycetota bacterium]|nr:hypothetical protein [Actinomycetota bacterium]
NEDLAALLDEIRKQNAELVYTRELLRDVMHANATIQHQMEAVLASQRRTHSLLELSLGSAFDAELDPPGVQP